MRYGDNALGVECAMPARGAVRRRSSGFWRRLLHLIARLARLG